MGLEINALFSSRRRLLNRSTKYRDENTFGLCGTGINDGLGHIAE